MSPGVVPIERARPQPAGGRIRWAIGGGAALLIAYAAYTAARQTGATNIAVDGWGVAAFESVMSLLCVCRYFEPSWRSSQSTARAFPLIMGAASLAWSIGDVVLTGESVGGHTPPVPSLADGFYLAFFPLCYFGLMMLIRRGNGGSLISTSLDGLIAGLGAAALAAAFLFEHVVRATDAGTSATAVTLAYPIGDVLLMGLTAGCLAVLPRGYRAFFALTCLAQGANAIGDTFNLLSADTRLGHISDALAWPIALFALMVATWILPGRVEKPSADKTAGFVLSSFGAVASVAILITASVSRVSRPALGLTTATLVVAAVRLARTVREAQALKTARFRSLIDKAWDLIVVIEPDLSVAYITPSVERVLGRPSAAVQGRALADLVHPEDVSSLVGCLRGLRANSTGVFETRTSHGDGSWRTIEWTATNLLDDPSVGGFVLNGVDVTESRQSARELIIARDEAMTASKAKSQFLAIMSHEIRTPMNGVIGLTELLLDTNLDRDQRELTTGVKVSAENLMVIINEILDFSKIEAGKMEIEVAPLQLGSLVDDVGRILAQTAHAKQLELIVDVDPEIPLCLLGDAVRIQQILLNLGSNAVKFTSSGEVIIKVAVAHRTSDRVAVRFEVTDEGIGIPPELQPLLFQPFSQADSSTTRKFGGTGLGLAISRQLVELMGGRIGLTSTPGVGSTFWFDLSLRQAAVREHPDSEPPITTLEGKQILVVDDNPTNRMIVSRQLRSWGAEPVEASSAEEALAAVSDETCHRPFDVALLDLNMPGMDGLQLARVLKESDRTSSIVLILLTSSGGRMTDDEVHLAGLSAVLTKPVRTSELHDCLVTCLNPDAPEPTRAPATPNRVSKGTGVILLVEDNKMNQLVASKILDKLGYRYDIASHGGEAVTALGTTSYDAVLMDCEMPEMDGFAATAHIRGLPGPAAKTPIIAMTAAAMDGDRERCLDAGMDDYITKPVKPEIVAATLARWVKVSAPPPRDVVDLEQIDLLRQLDDGAGEALREILDEFLAYSAAGHDEILRHLAEHDTHSLERAAHTMKGASSNVGATALVNVCSEMERLARAASLDDVAGLVDDLDAELARARETLSALAAEVSS